MISDGFNIWKNDVGDVRTKTKHPPTSWWLPTTCCQPLLKGPCCFSNLLELVQDPKQTLLSLPALKCCSSNDSCLSASPVGHFTQPPTIHSNKVRAGNTLSCKRFATREQNSCRGGTFYWERRETHPLKTCECDTMCLHTLKLALMETPRPVTVT